MNEYAFDTIIELLRNAPRQGTETDTPEGIRYIVISDTLALELADKIEECWKDIAL